MANNPVVNSITFAGSVAGQASIQAQGIAGGLTLLLPNTTPNVLQLLEVQAINGNNVFLGWVSPQSSSINLSQILPSGATSGQTIIFNGTNWVPSTGLPGEGTVTSVAVTVPAWLAVSGSPITSAGTIAITSAPSLTANFVLATPNGSAGVLSPRALVAADIPALPYLPNSTVLPANRPAAGSNWINSYNSSTGVFTISQPSVTDVTGAAPLASPTFTGTVVLPSAVHATGGSDLIFTQTGANKVRIATATGVFDFFGTGGGMTLGTANSQVAIDASGNINLSATGGSNLSVNSAGGLVTSSDFKPTNLFSFPGNTSGTAGQLFSSLGTDSGTAWIDPSSLGFAPTANPTFTGLVVLPSAASTPGLAMASDNQNTNTNAPIVFTSATATNQQVISITPNGFFGPMMQFSGQNAPYTGGRLTEIGAQGLWLDGRSGFYLNGHGGLGTSGQVLTTLGADTDIGPKGLTWVSQSGTGGNTLASAKTNLTAAPAGDIVTADGSGNVQDSSVPVANVPLKAVRVLSSSDLLSLGTTPVQVIPAPGVGKYVSPLFGVASYHFGTTPYTGAGTSTHFFILNSANQPNVATAFGNQSGFIDALGTSTSSVIQMGSSFGFSATAADLDNQAFTISFDTASNILTLGDGTVTITVYYNIETSAA